MTIRFACDCGRQLAAADEHIGKRVKCTACGGIQTVPAPARSAPQITTAAAPSADRIRFECDCGQTCQARPEHAGKKTKCPACGAILTVPSPEQAAVIYSKNGQPLYSWRVALLPYLEQDPLYKQFKLDEAWNSPHNSKLVARMPPVFDIPGSKAPAGKTFIQAFVGQGTAFPTGKQGLRLPLDFKDGTSNTILVAESNLAQAWTAPSDMSYDPRFSNPKFLVGNHTGRGTLVGMADGAVKVIPATVSDKTWKAAVTASAGDLLGPDWPK